MTATLTVRWTRLNDGDLLTVIGDWKLLVGPEKGKQDGRAPRYVWVAMKTLDETHQGTAKTERAAMAAAKRVATRELKIRQELSA